MGTWIVVWNKAVGLTLMGLALSVTACWLALQGEPGLAWMSIIGAGLCDLFDGFVARRLELSEEEQDFGVQIDSLVDIASFGVAPAIVFMACVGTTNIVAVAVAALYTVCAAMRLGYFNVHGTTEEGGTKYYRGLPVTYAALFGPLGFLASRLFEGTLAALFLGAVMVALAFFFVRDVAVPKPQGIWYAIFPTMAAVAIGCLAWIR